MKQNQPKWQQNIFSKINLNLKQCVNRQQIVRQATHQSDNNRSFSCVLNCWRVKTWSDFIKYNNFDNKLNTLRLGTLATLLWDFEGPPTTNIPNVLLWLNPHQLICRNLKHYPSQTMWARILNEDMNGVKRFQLQSRNIFVCAYKDAKSLLSVWRKKWITFDRSYHIGFGDTAPLDTTPPGLWSAKSPFPMIQSSLWGLELHGHGKPFWKPLISPTTIWICIFEFWVTTWNFGGPKFQKMKGN